MEKKIRKLKRALNAVYKEFDALLQAQRKNYVVQVDGTRFHLHSPADLEEFFQQKKQRKLVIRGLLGEAIDAHLRGKRKPFDLVLAFTKGPNPDDFVCEPSEHQIPGDHVVPESEQGPKALNMESYQVKNDLGLIGEPDEQK